jgi:hypothetical protein
VSFAKHYLDRAEDYGRPSLGGFLWDFEGHWEEYLETEAEDAAASLPAQRAPGHHASMGVSA